MNRCDKRIFVTRTDYNIIHSAIDEVKIQKPFVGNMNDLDSIIIPNGDSVGNITNAISTNPFNSAIVDSNASY